jgi:predicted MFS family arabinose efflux permease
MRGVPRMGYFPLGRPLHLPTLPTMSERLLIALLTAIQFTYMVDFVLMMPLGPQLQRELHCDAQAFSLLVASYTIAGGIASLLAASFIDRFDRKRLLLAVYAGMALATILCGLCDQYATLLCARIAAGACGGLIGSLVMTIIGARIPYERRGMATGAVMSAFSLASVLGIPIGLLLAQGSGWTLPFLVLGGVGLVILMLAMRILDPMREHLGEVRRNPWEMLTQVVQNAQHRKAFALTISLTFAGFSVIPLLATYVVQNAGLAEKNLLWLYGLGGLVTMVTGPLIGRLSDRFGKHALFMVVAGLSIIPIVAVTNLPPVPELVTLGISVLFVMLVSGRFVPAMAIITQAADPAVRGAFQAYNTAVQSLSSGAAALIAGLVVSQGAGGRLIGYEHTGWIAVAATLVSIALALRLRPFTGSPAPAVAGAVVPDQPIPGIGR